MRRQLLNPLYNQITAGLREAGTIRRPRITPELNEAINRMAMQQVRRVERQQRKRFRSTVGRVLGRRPVPDVSGTLERAVARNARLMNNLALELGVTFERKYNQIGELTAENIRAALEDSYRVVESKIGLISDNESESIFQEVNRERLQGIGVRDYVWESRRDDRVRRTHRANNGKTFAFDNPPPATGNPGDEIRCRCRPIPLLPE